MHFLENVFLNAGAIGILLALIFWFFAWQGWRSLKAGANGTTKATMLFFLVLAIEHVFIAAAFISLTTHLAETVHPGYINYARLGVAVSMLFLALSSVFLYLEARINGQRD